MGSSKEDLIEFPEEIRRLAGQQLRKVQFGEDADDADSMSRVGAGCYELRFRDKAGWYRVIYVAKFEKAVYVLHSFSKKTNATPQTDIDLAIVWYGEAKRHAGVK